MEKRALCEIILTNLKGREWQGSVYFPACNQHIPFQNLMELILAVERQHPLGSPDQQNMEM